MKQYLICMLLIISILFIACLIKGIEWFSYFVGVIVGALNVLAIRSDK